MTEPASFGGAPGQSALRSAPTGSDPAAAIPIRPVPVRRTSLAWRVTAACLGVAVVAVGVAAVVALRLVSMTARQVTRDVLAEQADVVAAQLTDTGGGVRGVLGPRRVVQVLVGQGISVVSLGPRPAESPGTDAAVGTAIGKADAERAVAGQSVSAVVEVAGSTYLVEARPTPSGGVALVRTIESGPLGSGVIRHNIGFALAAGGVVAVLVGVVVGRLLARPLRRTAAAAHVLRSGRRDVRVPVEGPGEVAEVAMAVNELADALTHSEARQREFLLSVSHELRTPLTAVRGFAESLADGVVTGPEVAPIGRTIAREAQRLDRLVNDLMELARLEADDFRVDLRPLDLTALIGEAAAVWRARCRDAGVNFQLTVPAGPVAVLADPRRLRQVLDGLAENALRVTLPGAPLLFAVHAQPGGGVLQIRDGGPGLTPEDYPVLFQRGTLHTRYRGQRPVGAGGVGLALVHGLVTRMGAKIHAEPAPEGGVCFTVTLPATGPGPGR